MNNMYEYTFYIGTKDKDSKLENRQAIERICDKMFTEKFPNGYTKIFGEGIYKHDDGTSIKEITLIYKVLTHTRCGIFASDIAKATNQEAVMVTVQNIEMYMYPQL